MSEELTSTSPAEPSRVLGRFTIASESAVSDAVARARDAFPAWRDAGLEKRTAVLHRFRTI